MSSTSRHDASSTIWTAVVQPDYSGDDMNLTAKQVYLVTYDIADPKRLAATYKVMKGFGDHLQLSVFRCELTERQMVEMKQALLAVINAREDQVLLIDLGPTDGRGGEAISSLGRAFDKAGRKAIVI